MTSSIVIRVPELSFRLAKRLQILKEVQSQNSLAISDDGFPLQFMLGQ